jgi:hypothetical protein
VLKFIYRLITSLDFITIKNTINTQNMKTLIRAPASKGNVRPFLIEILKLKKTIEL